MFQITNKPGTAPLKTEKVQSLPNMQIVNCENFHQSYSGAKNTRRDTFQIRKLTLPQTKNLKGDPSV